MLEQENSNSDPLISNVKGFADLSSCGHSSPGAASLTSSSGEETDGDGFSSGYHSCNSVDSPFNNGVTSPVNINIPSPSEIITTPENSVSLNTENSVSKTTSASMCNETENGMVVDSELGPTSLSAEQALDIIFSNAYSPDQSDLNSVSGIDLLEEFLKTVDCDGKRSDISIPNIPQPAVFNPSSYNQGNTLLNLDKPVCTTNTEPISVQNTTASSQNSVYTPTHEHQHSETDQCGYVQEQQNPEFSDKLEDVEMRDIESVQRVNTSNPIQSCANSNAPSKSQTPNRVSYLRYLLSGEVDKTDPVLPKMFNSVVSKGKEKIIEPAHSRASQVTSTVMSTDGTVVSESDQLLSSNDPMWKGSFESQLQSAFSKAGVSLQLSSINPTDLPTSNAEGYNSSDVNMLTSNEVADNQTLPDEFLDFALQYCDTLAEEQARSVIAGLSQDTWPGNESIETLTSDYPMTNESTPAILPDSSNFQSDSPHTPSQQMLVKEIQPSSSDSNVVSSSTDFTESKLRAMLVSSQQQKSPGSASVGCGNSSSHSNNNLKEQSQQKNISSMSELEKVLRGYAAPRFHFQEHECTNHKNTQPNALPDSFDDDRPLLQKLLTGEISKEMYQRIDRHIIDQQKRRMSSEG